VPIYVFLFAASVVAGVAVLTWTLHGFRVDLPTRRRRLVRANLGAAAAAPPDQREVVLAQSASVRLLRPTMTSLADAARRLTPSGLLDRLDRRRYLAGVATRWSLEQLLAAKLLLGGIGLVLGVVVFTSNPGPWGFLAGVAFPFCGFFGPDVVLDGRARERQGEIERAFPDVLDQVTICVEAGLGLDAALAHAARTGHGPLAEELSRVLQDIQVGVPRQTALENMAARTSAKDLRPFVVAVGQASRYGVAVADVLRVQATDARERRRARAEERAQKMAVKLLFPLIFCILPALFVVLLGPAAIRISDLGLGGH
jgi:tight adherence protein C